MTNKINKFTFLVVKNEVQITDKPVAGHNFGSITCHESIANLIKDMMQMAYNEAKREIKEEKASE
jgi:hypothetical protein